MHENLSIPKRIKIVTKCVSARLWSHIGKVLVSDVMCLIDLAEYFCTFFIEVVWHLVTEQAECCFLCRDVVLHRLHVLIFKKFKCL